LTCPPETSPAGMLASKLERERGKVIKQTNVEKAMLKELL
jgi:hypothetical protein